MNLNFLISISAETESHNGVLFLTSFMKDFKGCEVTLFHISSSKNSSQSSIMGMWDNPDGTADVSLSASARKALNRSKRMLDSSGILVNSVKTKTVKEQFGKVKDILVEGTNGLYDAMILGRRATYALQWVFDKPADEIPQALVRDASLSSPMWICSEPEEGRKNVLLCLDGSTSALRMTDHVGYILSFATHHNITLFHVNSLFSKDESESIFFEAIEILEKHDINQERIHKKTVQSLSVINAILAEKNNGKYASVAIGLTGKNDKEMLDPKKSVGKTPATLISKISKASLWCCP